MKSEANPKHLDEALLFLGHPPRYIYDFDNCKGFPGEMRDETVDRVNALPNVEMVLNDTFVQIADYVAQNNAAWGLSRISHIDTGHDTYIFDGSSGADTCVHVIDSDILIEHL
ncbi:hypothetical protein K432DRAFT_408228 [Lepidopterella palustris CBS 459.81]|uniref:Uncharacterized protein n=1 Tax=Lepidopterella palustris CBS 459.81 TaxID=1314670 RepID=A0A8E2JBI5_9PEZI|nr:hypothetical protein K432DRAFT_408228 [Lepidopterella palustris CBS 459.81]